MKIRMLKCFFMVFMTVVIFPQNLYARAGLGEYVYDTPNGNRIGSFDGCDDEGGPFICNKSGKAVVNRISSSKFYDGFIVGKTETGEGFFIFNENSGQANFYPTKEQLQEEIKKLNLQPFSLFKRVIVYHVNTFSAIMVSALLIIAISCLLVCKDKTNMNHKKLDSIYLILEKFIFSFKGGIIHTIATLMATLILSYILNVVGIKFKIDLSLGWLLTSWTPYFLLFIFYTTISFRKTISSESELKNIKHIETAHFVVSLIFMFILYVFIMSFGGISDSLMNGDF